MEKVNVESCRKILVILYYEEREVTSMEQTVASMDVEQT